MYYFEQRKRALSIFANFIILLCESVSYGYVWFKYYKKPSYQSRDFIVIGMYVLFVFMITKSLNGYKNSYMRSLDLCFSHVIAIIFSAIVGHIFISMVSGDYVTIKYIVVMALLQSVFVIVWVILVRQIYIHLYPPRRVIIIYGNYPRVDTIN